MATGDWLRLGKPEEPSILPEYTYVDTYGRIHSGPSVLSLHTTSP